MSLGELTSSAPSFFIKKPPGTRQGTVVIFFFLGDFLFDSQALHMNGMHQIPDKFRRQIFFFSLLYGPGEQLIIALLRKRRNMIFGLVLAYLLYYLFSLSDQMDQLMIQGVDLVPETAQVLVYLRLGMRRVMHEDAGDKG